MTAYTNNLRYLRSPAEVRDLIRQSVGRRQVSQARPRPSTVVKRIGSENVEAIVGGYKRGKTTADLASEFGIRRRAVRDILTTRGVDLQRQVKLSQLEREEAVRLYRDECLSIAKVANRLGVPIFAVRRTLNAEKVEMRGRYDRPQKA